MSRAAWLAGGLLLAAEAAGFFAPATFAQDRRTLVPRALYAEAVGQSAQRTELARQAARLAGDDDAELQTLAGRVRYAGDWRTPEEVADHVREGGRLEAFEKFRMAERRDAGALARYCDAHGLPAHAEYYWRFQLRSVASREALQALGLEVHRGQFVTAQQARQYEAELADAKARHAEWQRRVTDWTQASSLDEVRRSAMQAFQNLAGYEALAAAQALTAVPPKPKTIAKSTKLDLEPLRAASLELARALAVQREWGSTSALLHLILSTRWPDVRDEAAKGLRGRPMNGFAPQLLAGLESPMETKFSVYAAPDGTARTFHTIVREGPRQHDAVTRQTNVLPRADATAALPAGAGLVRGAAQQAASLDAQVQRANAQAELRNEWLMSALRIATGEKHSDPRRWWKWWTEWNELNFDEPQTRERLYVSNYRYSYYQNYYTTEYQMPPGTPMYPHSCFAQGTRVWTISGLQSIETIRRGELVLAQDPESGQWAFKPVVATTVGPPTEVLEISTPVDKIVATKGHPFWVPCVGWQMAKQLKPGDLLHGFDGSHEVLTSSTRAADVCL